MLMIISIIFALLVIYFGVKMILSIREDMKDENTPNDLM